MKTIPLTQGKVALVDDADFERVNQFKWSAKRGGDNWYAYRSAGYVGGRQKQVTLHVFLFPGHPRVDHKNGDGLNNQRHNLRPATHTQNMRNRRKRAISSSQYKGVTRRKSRWIAQIEILGKGMHLGVFDTEVAAARAYDTKARELFGEFSQLNFP